MSHGYEGGRLDLPFVGICTFGKYPLCLDWDRIEADVAVLGAPFDPSGLTALTGATIMFELLCILAGVVDAKKAT